MTEFTDLNLAAPILKAVQAEGYTEPTPIQAKVIPEMMNGHDVVGIAQTGTGKTAAFVLPILDAIANQNKRPQPKHCYALILAPTRELAQQITDSIRTYGKNMRHSVTLVVGGAKAFPQIRALSRGVDIVVATPGRLLDHMNTGAIKLADTSLVVLDEADQMLDMGFIPAIRDILKTVRNERQMVLLSATMPKPIRKLAADFLRAPREVSVAETSKPIERIDQKVHLVDKPAKGSKLVELLGAPDVSRTIVFTRTKHGADKVQVQLQKAGFSAEAIHGNKSQGQRVRALAAFKTGKSAVLVATDIAARGIDIDGVSHVVNFDLPNVAESYVHRIGRTARAGASGIAHSLVDITERGLLRDIERLIGYNLLSDEERGEEGRDFSRQNSKGRRRGGANAGKPGAVRKWKSGPKAKPKSGFKSKAHDRRDDKVSEGPSERVYDGFKSAPKSKPATHTPSHDKPAQMSFDKPAGEKSGYPKGKKFGGKPGGKPVGAFKGNGKPKGKFQGKPKVQGGKGPQSRAA